MTKALFILLITISGMVGIDPSSSHYSSSSLSFDQLISDKHSSLLHGNFKRNAMSPSSFSDDFAFNSLISNQTRSKRAADPLSDYSGKLSTVARISNGISLLAGLINKNIPIDAAIEELLHFGTVKLSDVLALQKDKVEAVISQLNTVKTGLDKSSNVIDLEDNTIGMARILDAYKENDFGSFQIPTDYFSEAKTFKADKTDYSMFTNAATNAKSAIDSLAKIENAPELTAVTSAFMAGNILQAKTNLNDMERFKADLEALSKKIESLSKLVNGVEILKPVQQMLDLVALYPKLPIVKVDDVGEAGKNMDSVTSFSSNFATTAQSNFPVLSGFVSSRLKRFPTTCQYTTGFTNGASDLKKLTNDLRDPAFESTIGTGKNFGRLSGGLKPLMDWSVKLEASESSLKPIATSEILQSARNAAELQKLTSGLKVASADAVSVAQLMIDNKPGAVRSTKVNEMIKLMENAVKLSKDLAHIKSSASSFPQPPQEVSDVKDILGKLTTNDQQQVRAVIDALKGVPAKVKATTEYLNKLQDFLKDVPDPTDTRGTADFVSQAEGNLKKFKSEIETDVAPKLNVIKDSKEPIESVVRALQASKIIRDFKEEDGTNINVALDAITKAASSIKELQKPPANRKKRQTDEVKELVTWKNAQRMSAALGLSAITISSMAQLKGMETTVVQDLKSKSPIFDTEVAKVTDSSKKSEILKKWGDHKAFTSSLDSTINQIKAFGAKLSVDKDLRKLGAHLNDAKAVGDVKQNIAEKSEAVEILISETTTPNSDLQALKTQLDTLATLDLQFSSHHSAFPDVQGALKSFFDFVTGFVTPKKQSPQAAAGAAGAAAAADSSVLVYSLGGVGGVVGIIIIAGLSVYVYRRIYEDKKKPWELIEKKWIFRIYFEKVPDSAGFARSLMNEINKEVGQLKTKKTELTKLRFDKTMLLEATAVSLPDRRFINASWIKSKGGARFITTQGPLKEKLGPQKKDKEGNKLPKKVLKEDTREDFLYMCVVHEVEFIVQLCDFNEIIETLAERRKRIAKWKAEEVENVNCVRRLCRTDEADKEVKGNLYYQWDRRLATMDKAEKSGRYYCVRKGSSMTVGKYKVMTDSVDSDDYLFGNPVEERKLTITDTTTEKVVLKCTHLFHRDWPDHSVPDDANPVVNMMNKVRFSKKPIVVHCSTGTGRSVSFIASDVIACDAQRHPGKKTADMFIPIRQSRNKALQTPPQAHFAVEVAHGLLIDEYKRRGTESEETYKKHLKVMDAARVLLETEDVNEADRVREERENAAKNKDEKPEAKNKDEKSEVWSQESEGGGEMLKHLARHLKNEEEEARKRKEKKNQKNQKNKKASKKPEKSQQTDSVQTDSNATTPPSTGGKGNETPMGTPKTRETGGADHVAIDME